MADIQDLLGFEQRPPSHQNAIDLFPDAWTSAMPAASGLSGGTAAHFDDARVLWGAQVLGGLHGRSILELGPYEAYNTYQFQMAGASHVVAIEASRINFLKCLVIKNIFGLTATFLHGDFQNYLATTQSRYDICWASGVLYHMTKPIELLQNICRIASTAFIWTQYYDEAVISGTANAAFFDPARDVFAEVAGREIRLHHRNYNQAAGLHFSGGEGSYSYWMTRDDIMFVLQSLGFGHIQVGIDNPAHPPGPAMFFIASSSG